jgi:hypothetical protein
VDADGLCVAGQAFFIRVMTLGRIIVSAAVVYVALGLAFLATDWLSKWPNDHD